MIHRYVPDPDLTWLDEMLHRTKHDGEHFKSQNGVFEHVINWLLPLQFVSGVIHVSIILTLITAAMRYPWIWYIVGTIGLWYAFVAVMYWGFAPYSSRRYYKPSIESLGNDMYLVKYLGPQLHYLNGGNNPYLCFVEETWNIPRACIVEGKDTCKSITAFLTRQRGLISYGNGPYYKQTYDNSGCCGSMFALIGVSIITSCILIVHLCRELI